MSNRIQPGDVEYALATACVALNIEPSEQIFAHDSIASFYAAAAIYRIRKSETWDRIARRLLVDAARFSDWYKANRSARREMAHIIIGACARSVEQRRLVAIAEMIDEAAEISARNQQEHAEASAYFAAMQSRKTIDAEPATQKALSPEELKPATIHAAHRMPAAACAKPARVSVSVPMPGDKPPDWKPPVDSGENFAGRDGLYPSTQGGAAGRARSRGITLPRVSFLEGKTDV